MCVHHWKICYLFVTFRVCVCLLVGCLTSLQHASVSQGRICSDNFTCCYTEIQVADQTFYLTQSQYTDTGPTSPSADPIPQAPGRVATGVPIFKSLVLLDPGKIPAQAGFEAGIFRSRGGRLTSRPTRRSRVCVICIYICTRRRAPQGYHWSRIALFCSNSLSDHSIVVTHSYS